VTKCDRGGGGKFYPKTARDVIYERSQNHKIEEANDTISATRCSLANVFPVARN